MLDVNVKDLEIAFDERVRESGTEIEEHRNGLRGVGRSALRVENKFCTSVYSFEVSREKVLRRLSPDTQRAGEKALNVHILSCYSLWHKSVT